MQGLVGFRTRVMDIPVWQIYFCSITETNLKTSSFSDPLFHPAVADNPHIKTTITFLLVHTVD